MPPLRRHQLAHLSATGWRSILDRAWDAESRACLQHWAAHALPLVVTRQRGPDPSQDPHDPHDPPDPHDRQIALGLAAPSRWLRRPIAIQVAGADLLWLSEFPVLTQALAVRPRVDRPPLQALAQALARQQVRAHVYGSAGWQHLTGLDYLHERSDLDLWLAVDDARQADAAVGVLQAFGGDVRLDGELMFPDGSAVAWREWAAWRDGRCRQVLVKRLHGVALEAQPAALADAGSCPA